MKKLLMALFLAVILTATLATPAFADGGNGNMGGKNAGTSGEDPLRNPQGWIIGLVNGLGHLGWGPYIAHAMTGKYPDPAAYGWYAMSRSIHHILNGQPPAKPPWAGGP